MNLSPNQELIIKAAEILPMAEARDFIIFITGKDKRYRAVEYNLPVLTKKKNVLIRVRNGRRGYIYKLRGKGGIQKEKIYHDLTSTRALLRFKTSKEGVFFGERFFKEARVYPLPEWAVLYDNVLFLFEFSTANNFKRTDLMREKVAQYLRSYDEMKDYFSAEPITIFLLEAPIFRVEAFAKEHDYEQFYYTDIESFFSVGRGDQLDAPIYIWGGDGRSYSLYQ
jgi:hypothetical protein